jgi:hypothetical protein
MSAGHPVEVAQIVEHGVDGRPCEEEVTVKLVAGARVGGGGRREIDPRRGQRRTVGDICGLSSVKPQQ